MTNFILPLGGGAVIGVAVSLMLYLNGRVTGVSGILNGVFEKVRRDFYWRIAFICGLLIGGLILRNLLPNSLNSTLSRSFPTIIIAGFLVGLGTVMGSGCTSGHGICGLSRLSPRSFAATIIFMIFGILTATLFRTVFGAA